MQVTVITRDILNPDNPASRKLINYSSKASRIWLSRHSLWAFHNNHSVTTFVEKSNGQSN